MSVKSNKRMGKKRRRQRRIRRIFFSLSGLLLLLCVGGGVWWITQSRKTQAVDNADAVPEKEKSEEAAKEEPKAKEEKETPITVLQAEEPEAEEAPSVEAEAEAMLQQMTLEEKIAQLFIVTPEALTGSGGVTAAGEATREALARRPVGGLVYFQQNLQSPEQTAAMLANTMAYSREQTDLPMFLCVDEEGGTVTRISGRGFGVESIEDMAVIGQNGDTARAQQTGDVMGTYLHDLGFTVDFAPCADVLTNPENQVVARRSFGSDAGQVAEMVSLQVDALEAHEIWAVPKHFPGHGATRGDSHQGYAYTDRTLEELKAEELVPFQRLIDDGIQWIMVGHISCPNVTGDELPASLSHYMMTDLLRDQMGYQGLIITDALNMGAIQNQYSSGTAARMAFLAGADLLLMPADFSAAYQGMYDAVSSGEITEERLDASVRRILNVKLSMEE